MKSPGKLNILIVEDEALLAFAMEEMLRDFDYDSIEVVHDLEGAVFALEQNPPDLAILDINLGEGNEGLVLAKKCFLEHIPFFYVTSYTDRKTLDLALETTPGAYLIKPVIPSNLYSAVNLTLQNLKKYNSFIFKDGATVVKLNSTDILYLQADGIYLKVVTSTKSYLSRMSLASALENLPQENFIQIHRSYVVNLSWVTKSKSNLVFIDEIEIPLSRTFKDDFRKEFEKLL